MTIELITGTPGAGKTTYAVAERVASEITRKLKTDEGVEYTRRVLTAGVRGLVLEHERLPHKLTGEKVTDQDVEFWNAMASGDTPLYQRLAGDAVVDQVEELKLVDGVPTPTGKTRPVSPMVQNWWLWCKPGDLIVVDEAQFLAPRGILGRKAPYWIQCLEIHRHYGVDFIIITQHPQLIDTTIRNLVGLHRHVRSVMGSAVCMTYVWDHASNPERASLASKKAWVRRAKHYKLFHSSVAHIKPPSAGRGALLAAFLLLGAFGFGITNFLGKFSPPEAVAAEQGTSSTSPVGQTDQPPPSDQVEPQPAELRIVGCIDPGNGRGYCIDNQGGRVDMAPDAVAWNARHYGGFIKLDVHASSAAAPTPTPAPAPPQPSPAASDVEPYAFGGYPSDPGAQHDGALLASMRK